MKPSIGLGTGKDIVLEPLPLDENGLPLEIPLQPGDELLPWRKGRIHHRPRLGDATPWRKEKAKSRDTSLDKLQGTESQVKPWTEEAIVLKRTPQIPRETPKEKLEEVELKPAKIEKKEIRRASLEAVDLKHVTKEVTKDVRTEEKIARLEETTAETYVEEEDSRFIKTTKKVDETVQQKKEETKPWTEEKVTLKKAKPDRKEIPRETIEPVELKPSRIVKKDIEKPSLEKVDLKPVPATVTEKVSEEIISKTDYLEQEDTSMLDVSRTEEVRKIKKEKIEEKVEQAKPWTEEKITLKKSKPIRKEVEKETIETVELKPSKVEKLPIRKPSVEKVDLKPIPTAVTEKVTEKITEKTEYLEQEDTSLLDVSKTEELKKLRKEKIEEKPEGPKPWTEEKVTLKKAKPMKKEVEKETLETVELKPSKIIKSEVRKESLETVDLKSVTKEITEKTVKEVHKTDYVEQEDTTLLDVTKDTRVKKLRKESISTEKVEQLKPWTDEKITLKRTKPDKKEIPKEQIETVELKPSRPEKGEIEKPSLEAVDLKPIPKKEVKEVSKKPERKDVLTEEEDTTLLQVSKDTETTVKMINRSRR